MFIGTRQPYDTSPISTWFKGPTTILKFSMKRNGEPPLVATWTISSRELSLRSFALIISTMAINQYNRPVVPQ